MSRYTILILLNIPFVFFGYTKAIVLYRGGKLQRFSFALRIVFWSVLLAGLLLAKSGFQFLIDRNLTDSTPLSIADVFLVTGIMFSLFLSLRLYAKTESLERKITSLNERISTILSEKK